MEQFTNSGFTIKMMYTHLGTCNGCDGHKKPKKTQANVPSYAFQVQE
jgi:hypothetical protein